MALYREIGNYMYTQEFLDNFKHNIRFIHKCAIGSKVNCIFKGKMAIFEVTYTVDEIIGFTETEFPEEFFIQMQNHFGKHERIKAMKAKPKKYIISGQY